MPTNLVMLQLGVLYECLQVKATPRSFRQAQAGLHKLSGVEAATIQLLSELYLGNPMRATLAWPYFVTSKPSP
jgi:hypothetical protein